MSNDRKLSEMMDDVGGKWSDGLLRLTVHLSPEQLLCVLLKAAAWVRQVAEGLTM